MVLALWMEWSPLAQAATANEKIVGAVLVTEDERRLAIDCTRDGVHALARLLMRHSTELRNATIFTSRKPCSFCAKLLVQCGIRKLNYLPIEPENDDKDDLQKVDNLLKFAPVGHSVFVPEVDEKALYEAKGKQEKASTPETPMMVNAFQKQLMDHFWNKEWMDAAQEKLPWPACDAEMLKCVENNFVIIMKWVAEVIVGGRTSQGCEFVRWPSDQENKVLADNTEKKLFHHLLAMAKILAQRTDDPRTGVGAVISTKHDKEQTKSQIVATGWNGFPAKALYGEFPRASDKDKEVSEAQKKYPFVIHAEQSAILMRNTKDISGSTLFLTRTPCHECVPLLKLAGVKRIVIGMTEQEAVNFFKSEGGNLNYKVFPEEIKKGTFTCYVIEEKIEEKPLALPDSTAAKKLNLD